MTPVNWQDSSRSAHRTRSRSTPIAVAIPSSQSFQIQWMGVSFALMGIIAGFFLHAFTLPSEAASSLPSPSPIAQQNIIRPPDPNVAPQGGGCGGGSTQGGGCGGGATGGGCGGGASGGGCGGGAQGGGCGARPQPAPSSVPSQS